MKYLVDIIKKRIRLSDILIILMTHHALLRNMDLFDLGKKNFLRIIPLLIVHQVLILLMVLLARGRMAIDQLREQHSLILLHGSDEAQRNSILR
jgi:hypothetical protein